MSTERCKEIMSAVGDAMKALPLEGYDFSRVSDEISKAGHELNETMADYRDGMATRRQVQSKYKVWRDLHKTGGLFQ